MKVERWPIVPCPKPRMTQRDKWQQRPAVLRYRAFADECRARGVTLAPEGCQVVFVLPMPKSWSKKKKREMIGRPHQGKPDKDNLIKALADAIHGDDSHLWHDCGTAKFWGEKGEIIIITKEVEDEQRTLDGYLRAAGANQPGSV